MRYIIIFTVLLLSVMSCNLRNDKNRNTARAYELFNKALEYNLKELDSLALPLYDSAIILASDKAEFYTNRGYTKYQLRDTIGALNDYYKAIELDSLDMTTLMNIEGVFSDRKDYMSSLKYARKAFELGHIPAYFVAGQDLYMLGEYEAAIEAFLSFAEHNKEWSVFYSLGHSYAKLGQSENAKLCWDKANELAGYDIVAELNNKPNDYLVGK